MFKLRSEKEAEAANLSLTAGSFLADPSSLLDPESLCRGHLVHVIIDEDTGKPVRQIESGRFRDGLERIHRPARGEASPS